MLDDNAACYRHRETSAAVACQRCERPICTECMTPASIGFHCPECVAQHGQRVYRAQDVLDQRPPLTMALIAVNVVAFVGQLVTRDAITTEGLLWGPGIEQGELWRIVTGGFLHSGLLHLGFNMYALWIFGPNLEKGLGTLRFAIIYLAGLLGGTVAVLTFTFEQPTLGASGAVLGLAGGLSAVLWARGINIFRTSLSAILLINLALPLIAPGISFWGHLGGIVAGFIAGALLAWLPKQAGVEESVGKVMAFGFVGLLLAASLAIGTGVV